MCLQSRLKNSGRIELESFRLCMYLPAVMSVAMPTIGYAVNQSAILSGKHEQKTDISTSKYRQALIFHLTWFDDEGLQA